MFVFEDPISGHKIENEDRKKCFLQAFDFCRRYEPSHNAKDMANINIREEGL